MTGAGAGADRRRAATLVGGWIVLCGLVLLVWPGATIRVVVVLVGLGAFGFGVSELARVFAAGGVTLELWGGLVALANVVGGVLVLLSPLLSVDAARTMVGLYWLVAGLVEVVGALAKPDGRIERFAVGVLSLTAGAIAVLLPGLSLVVFVWLAGAWLVLVGLAVLALGRLASSKPSGTT